MSQNSVKQISSESKELALANRIRDAERRLDNLEKTSQKSIIEKLLPLITFLGGFLLSQLQKLRDEVKEKKNIKFILLKEIEKNYGLLIKVSPENKPLEAGIIQLIAIMSDNISTKAYDAYFSKISILENNLVQDLYNTYSAIQTFTQACKNFGEIIHEKGSHIDSKTRDKVASNGTIVWATHSYALEKLTSLLKYFKEGVSIINESERDKGSAIANLKIIEEGLKNK